MMIQMLWLSYVYKRHISVYFTMYLFTETARLKSISKTLTLYCINFICDIEKCITVLAEWVAQFVSAHMVPKQITSTLYFIINFTTFSVCSLLKRSKYWFHIWLTISPCCLGVIVYDRTLNYVALHRCRLLNTIF